MDGVINEDLMLKIEYARSLYYRLVLVVGPVGSGKTSTLRALEDAMSVPLINVNLELSRRMLDLTARQRALRLPRLLDEIVAAAAEGKAAADVVLLDNIEILFDTRLKQDPLRILQRLSRNRTVVASWNGVVSEGFLTYAVPGHPEFRRYPIHDILIVSLVAS
ncbi:ATPase AAA [Alicyclobacillus contaminans]|uniref:BREX-3 system P-loop-containing protein BrxF n=1 Tax=Alicyclobacillus contaminans TaxID=392016 RepID=UPI000410EAEF|nr:BREX-3 system P-loop-containing protein BrxF [Alicyclobacillus contaminans]GMA49220.1 ATPase AAA [Alicyclobacillus contaminans]